MRTLAKPMWQRGCREVGLQDIQRLVGRTIHFSGVFPPARAFTSGLLRVLAMMTQEGRQEGHVTPGLPMGDDETTWMRWWDELEWLRILVASTASWQSPAHRHSPPPFHLRSGIDSGPEGGRPLVFVGTDAAQWSWCAIN